MHYNSCIPIPKSSDEELLQRCVHRLLPLAPLLHSERGQTAGAHQLLERRSVHLAGPPSSDDWHLHQHSRGLVHSCQVQHAHCMPLTCTAAWTVLDPEALSGLASSDDGLILICVAGQFAP